MLPMANSEGAAVVAPAKGPHFCDNCQDSPPISGDAACLPRSQVVRIAPSAQHPAGQDPHTNPRIRRPQSEVVPLATTGQVQPQPTKLRLNAAVPQSSSQGHTLTGMAGNPTHSKGRSRSFSDTTSLVADQQSRNDATSSLGRPVRITPFQQARSKDGHLHYVLTPATKEPDPPAGQEVRSSDTSQSNSEAGPSTSRTEDQALQQEGDVEKGISINEMRPISDSTLGTVSTRRNLPGQKWTLIAIVSLSVLGILGTLIPAVIRGAHRI